MGSSTGLPLYRWPFRRARTFGSIGMIRKTRPVACGRPGGRAVLHPPQQVRAGLPGRLPQAIAVEAAVGDNQHSRLECADELFCQLPFISPRCAQPGSHNRVGPAFSQPDYPHLRERGWILVPRPACRTRNRYPLCLRYPARIRRWPSGGETAARPPAFPAPRMVRLSARTRPASVRSQGAASPG